MSIKIDLDEKRNKYEGWIEAFTIFAKYEADAEMAAEHDILYLGPDPEVVSEEDIDRLFALGFRPSENGECFYHFV